MYVPAAPKGTMAGRSTTPPGPVFRVVEVVRLAKRSPSGRVMVTSCPAGAAPPFTVAVNWKVDAATVLHAWAVGALVPPGPATSP